MKLKIALTFIIGILICLLLWDKCGKKTTHYQPEKDTVFVVEPIQEHLFVNTIEVLQTQKEMHKAYKIDSVFRSIDPYTLKNISDILIGRQGCITEEDIVKEFKRNYFSVYKYLNPDSPKVDTTIITDTTSIVKNKNDTSQNRKHI